MPNLTDTQLLSAITKAHNTIMGAPEFRDYEHSALKLALASESDVFRNLNQLKQSDEQPTKVDLIKRVYTASGTAKSASHSAAAFADSFVKDITYLKRVQKFKVSYKQADNNRFGYQEILQSEIKNKLMSMYADLSTYFTGWLDTNRTQVAVDSLIDFDEVTNYRFDNPSGEADFLFENIKAAMRKNKYMTPLDVVADQGIAKKYRKLASNGTMNADNTAYQIPGIDLVEEPQLASADSAYVWQKGLVGMTTWNEPMNRRGEGSVGDNQGLFTTFRDPILGYDHDLHVVRSIADTSASGGNVQDVVDEFEMTTIFTVQGAFESTANATPIFKFVQG